MSRGDVIKNAYMRYLRHEITLAELLATIREWRPSS